MDILAYIAMATISLILGRKMGYETGLKKGMSVGKDLEFYLFVSSLKRLEVQTKYNDVMKDVQDQYELELDKVAAEIRGER